MIESLIKVFFIGFLAIISSSLAAQNEHDRRILAADLRSTENLPFFRQGAELSRILVDNVRDGNLTAYFFGELNNPPQKLTIDLFLQNLERPSPYDEWDEDYDYLEFETVTYQGNLYVALLSDSNIGNQPDIRHEFWEKVEKTYYAPYDLSLIKVDEQYLDNNWHMQYLHLYIPAELTEFGIEKYIGSFNAQDAIEALNKSGFVWYTHYRNNSHIPAAMGHIIGNVYLSNYDNSAMESLLQNGYLFNNKVTNIIENSAYPDERLDLLYNYSGRAIDSIYITNRNSNEILDSMNFELNEEKSSEMHRFGDAVLLDLMISNEQNIQLKPHENFLKEKPNGRLNKKVLTTLRERIDFGVSNNASRSTLLTLMIEDIIKASNRGLLTMYESQSLFDYQLIPRKVAEPFVVDSSPLFGEEPEPFDSKFTYPQNQAVKFEGVAYISQRDNNKGNYPPFNPQDWQQLEADEAFYSSDAIKILDIDYHLVFKLKGNIKQKKPIRMGFIVPGEFTYDGINTNLGTIDFEQLEAYAKKNRKPWLKLLQIINSQDSLRFQMLDYVPLTEYKR